MRYIIFIPIYAILSFSFLLQAQTKRELYCLNNIANTSISTKEVFKDSIYATSNKNPKGIEITLFNTTNDTIYLFSSYLKSSYLKSKYLHRYNKKDKVNKLSLLPLIPFLSTNYSDNIIMGEEAIINRNQIVYDFIIIPPNKLFRRDFSNDELNVRISTNDIDLNKLNLNSKIHLKTVKCKKGESVKNILELAIYRNIETLCNESEYYTNMYLFNESAKDYEVIKIIL